MFYRDRLFTKLAIPFFGKLFIIFDRFPDERIVEVAVFAVEADTAVLCDKRKVGRIECGYQQLLFNADRKHTAAAGADVKRAVFIASRFDLFYEFPGNVGFAARKLIKAYFTGLGVGIH